MALPADAMSIDVNTLESRWTVGLDLRPTQPGFKAHFGRGTGRYATEMARHLGLLSSEDSFLEITGLNSSSLAPKTWEKNLISVLPAGKTTVEQQLLMPFRFQRSKVDLVHFFSHPDAPVFCRKPYIVTVLDLIPLKFPNLYRAHKPNWRFKFARYLENKAVQNATGILAISEATKRDVVELLGVEADRVFVAELAVDSRFIPRPWQGDDFFKAKEVARQKLNLPLQGAILLYIGGIDARKNIPFLIEVFRELLDNSRPEEQPVLVLAGRHDKDDQYPKLRQQIVDLGLEKSVLELGYVADNSLLDLYHAADVFVFPSIYEGFGLPILEAMAAAVPVVAGNNSSIPEVCGSDIPLLPDNDKESWVRGLQDLILDSALQRFRSEQGRKRSLCFTWETTAKKTLDVYRRVLLSKDK